MLNNPINLVDPTGHAAACIDGDYCPKSATYGELLAQFGVSLSGNWSSGDKASVLSAITKIGNRLRTLKPGNGAGETFKDIFGFVNFDRRTQTGQICQGGSGVVTCYANAAITDRFIMHELGHSFDAYQGSKGYSAIQKASIFTSDGDWVTGFHMVDGKWTWQRGLDGYPNVSGAYGVPDLYHGPGNWSDWNKLYAYDPKTKQDVYTGVAYTEEWADMFLNWADGTFQGEAGAARDTWMTNQLSSIINP